MKNIVFLIALWAVLMPAHAGPGFFRSPHDLPPQIDRPASAHYAAAFFDEKAGETCSVDFTWGRLFLNNLTAYPPALTTCVAELRAVVEAFASAPPLLWWNVVPAPPEGGPNGDCVMRLTWIQGSPAVAAATFATRVGGINGQAVPTQPGCVADSRAVAALMAQRWAVTYSKALVDRGMKRGPELED